MFTTHQEFRNPVQFDPRTINWRGVELMVGHPFLLVQTEEAECSRHLLLHGMDELLSVHMKPFFGALKRVSLLQPPAWSTHGDWEVIRMSELLLQAEPPDGSRPTAILRDHTGAMYGGYPIKKWTGDTGPVDFLLRI
jgi:hypothetical protein